MPDWNDDEAHALERGALALQLYVAKSSPDRPGEAVQAALPDHLAYQRDLEERGQLAFAGPPSDPAGARIEGDGMIAYRAASLEDAPTLAEADPRHARGVRRFTLRRWRVIEGSLTLSVGLSTQAATLR